MIITKISNFLSVRNNGSRIIGEKSVYNCNEVHKILFKEKYRTYIKIITELTERKKNLIKRYAMFLDGKVKYCRTDTSSQNNLK